MPRITPVETATAPQDSKRLLDAVQAAFGGLPNMFRTVAQSPAALDGMLGMFTALGRGKLGAALGESLAIAIANRNGCDYCLSAHTALGRKAGLDAAALADARLGKAADPRVAAALTFALALVDNRAHVGDADLALVRAAGFTDEEIVEIVAHTALNLFTNYINVAFAVDVDFPRVALVA